MGKPTFRVVAAMITRRRAASDCASGNGGGPGEGAEKEYLITQRRPEAVLPLKWEFPGGKVEADETDAAALKREMRERLSVDVEVGALVSELRHEYAGYDIDFCLYEARLEMTADLCPRAVHAFRWATSKEFDSLDFAAADEASLAKVLGLRGPGRAQN
jgi:8-oxo-dGTP diphosphatase